MLSGNHVKQNSGCLIFFGNQNNIVLPKPPPEEEKGDEKKHSNKERNKTTAISIVFGICFMFSLLLVATICFIIDAASTVALFKSLASIIIALCSIF